MVCVWFHQIFTMYLIKQKETSEQDRLPEVFKVLYAGNIREYSLFPVACCAYGSDVAVRGVKHSPAVSHRRHRPDNFKANHQCGTIPAMDTSLPELHIFKLSYSSITGMWSTILRFKWENIGRLFTFDV